MTHILNPVILEQFPYAFDGFQRDAALAIERGDHVLVTAHTSAGKSTVALYAIAKAVLENKRVIYTAPVKTLSNQKYGELKAKYGGLAGIQTGDVKVNPDAQIAVMTTEILRNDLARIQGEHSFDDVGYVIFDECHYINDPERGAVWEECIMRLPPSVQMILLSATMANPEEMAAWIEGLNPAKKVPIVSTLYRPVPLRFSLFIPNPGTFSESLPWNEAQRDGHLTMILDAEAGKFKTDAYISTAKRFEAMVAREWDTQTKSRNLTTGRKGVAEANAARASGKARQPFHMINLLNPFLNFLHINGQLPAIVFTLSRKKCDQYAKRVTTVLATPEELGHIDRTFEFYIRKLENPDQYAQVTALKACLAKGVGVHHSGMMPLLKEIVEILFTRGWIKVMFATETLAIGVNTPTKTVCFLDVTKFNGQTQRPLCVEEFKQMAGRAGRRGLDTVGNVVYFPVYDPVTSSEYQAMIQGSVKRIQSKFTVSTAFVLRSAFADKPEPLLTQIEASLQYQENQRMIKGSSIKTAELTQKRENLEIQLASLSEYAELYEKQKEREREKEKHTDKKKGRGLVSHSMELLSKSQQLEFDAYVHYRQQAEELDRQLAEMDKDRGLLSQLLQQECETTTQFLIEKGYLIHGAPTRANLTVKGLFAQNIHQSHEVILTEILLEAKMAESIREDPMMLGPWLALFIHEGGGDSESTEIRPGTDLGLDALAYGETLYDDLVRYGETASFKLSSRYIDPVWEWCNGAHIQTICQQYDLFEGNLLRALQKLIGLLDELEAGFTMIQRLDWVQSLGAVRELVKRDILKVESLYI